MTEKLGDFWMDRIGLTNYFVCYIKNIPMTGSDVTKQLSMPFAHRILHIKLYHGDANYDANTDNLACTFEVPQNALPDFPYWQDQLWKDLYIKDARRTHAFTENEGGVFDPRQWKVTLNTTNGHHVTIRVKIQMLEKTYFGKKEGRNVPPSAPRGIPD